MRTIRQLLVFLVLLLTARAASGQITETPIAFDSAGKVRTLTPTLVQRFGLKAPEWPVVGDFRDARLYAVSSGGKILVVDRPTGSVERYPLSDENVASLQRSIDATMTATGRTVTEERADVISEPANRAFVRNQMFLTWVAYAPLLGAVTRDSKAAASIYLLGTGASYFITTAITRKKTVTRAQNHLATDGALRGLVAASGVYYAITGDGDDDTCCNDTSSDERARAFVGFAGSLGGAIAGYHFGKGLTDSEAWSATAFSNYAAATTLGVIGTAVDESTDGRALTAVTVAAGLAGYVWGPNYPRRSSYTVTRGDVQMLNVGAALGVMTGLTTVIESDNPRLGFGVTTGTMLAGIALADRNWVRKFDHSASDASQVYLGMLAGGLIGAGGLVLAEVDQPTAVLGTLTGTMLAGAIIGQKLAAPAPAGGTRTGLLPSINDRLARSGVSFDPTALAMAGSKMPGNHSLVRITF
jgi:hypothetical protein